MAAIKIHLEAAELAASHPAGRRPARKTGGHRLRGAQPPDARRRESELHTDIKHTREWRGDNLPLWSDSATSIHAYESMPDEPSRPRKKQ